MNPIRVNTELCPIKANIEKIDRSEYAGFLFITKGDEKGFSFCTFRDDKLATVDPSESATKMFSDKPIEDQDIYFLSIEGLSVEDNLKLVNLDLSAAAEIEKITSNDMNVLLTTSFNMAFTFDRKGDKSYFYNGTIEKMHVPKVGGFCTHYNVLSEIMEVGKIGKDTYNLKLRSFFEEGTMVHSSSIFNLIMSNKDVGKDRPLLLSAVTMVTIDGSAAHQKVVCICERGELEAAKSKIMAAFPDIKCTQKKNERNWVLDFPKEMRNEMFFYSGDYLLNELTI